MLDDAVHACHKHTRAEIDAAQETILGSNAGHVSVFTARPNASSVRLSSALPHGICHILRVTLHHTNMLHLISAASPLPTEWYLYALTSKFSKLTSVRPPVYSW